MEYRNFQFGVEMILTWVSEIKWIEWIKLKEIAWYETLFKK